MVGPPGMIAPFVGSGRSRRSESFRVMKRHILVLGSAAAVVIWLLWSSEAPDSVVAPAKEAAAPPPPEALSAPIDGLRSEMPVRKALPAGLSFVDSDGPVAPVDVVFYAKTGRVLYERDVIGKVTTDPKGFVGFEELARVHPTPSAALIATSPSHDDVDLNPLLGGAAPWRDRTATLTITLRPSSGDTLLRVVDGENAAVPGMRVSLARTVFPRGFRSQPGVRPGVGVGALTIGEARFDGLVRFPKLASGEWWVALESDDWAIVTPDGRTLRVPNEKPSTVQVAPVLVGLYRYDGQLTRQKVDLLGPGHVPQGTEVFWTQEVVRRWPETHAVIAFGKQAAQYVEGLRARLSFPAEQIQLDLVLRPLTQLREEDIATIPRKDLGRCGVVQVKLVDGLGRPLRDCSVLLEPTRGHGDLRVRAFTERHIWAGAYRIRPYLQTKSVVVDFRIGAGERREVEVRVPTELRPVTLAIRHGDGTRPRAFAFRVKSPDFGYTSTSYSPEGTRLWVPNTELELKVDVPGFPTATRSLARQEGEVGAAERVEILVD